MGLIPIWQAFYEKFQCTEFQNQATHYYTDLAAVLLNVGAHPNTEDEFGWNPLHLAALHGRIEIAQLLLERGADPNKTNICGTTPLHHAAEKGHDEVVQLLNQSTIPGCHKSYFGYAN